MDSKTTAHIAMRTSIVSLVINTLLSILKLAIGIVANSGAMISDAIHSASDVFSTVIVMAGVKISSKEADTDHPYGHERFESVASIILATVLSVIGFEIGKEGVNILITGAYEHIKTPGLSALLMAAISIVIKEVMYRYTIHYARQINSTSLKADAWHHRSDSLSSVGALVGIWFARNGLPMMDAVASIFICIFILKVVVEIFAEALNTMVDKSADEKLICEIRDEINSVEGVKGIDDLKTRIFGNRLYVDVEIVADGKLSLDKAHDIAETVHLRIEERFPDTKHCMVHVNPG